MAGGYIGPGDGGFPASNAEDRWYFLGVRPPLAPPNWTVTGIHRGHITQCTQITTNAPTSFKEYPQWGNSPTEATEAGTVDGVWGEVSEDINAGTWAETIDPYSQDAPDDTRLKTTHGRMKNSLTANTAQTHAVHHQSRWAYDYDEATYIMSGIQSTRDVEVIGRESTWKPYAANRSASAWLAQWVISESLNKIAYESQQSWSMPL